MLSSHPTGPQFCIPSLGARETRDCAGQKSENSLGQQRRWKKEQRKSVHFKQGKILRKQMIFGQCSPLGNATFPGSGGSGWARCCGEDLLPQLCGAMGGGTAGEGAERGCNQPQHLPWLPTKATQGCKRSPRVAKKTSVTKFCGKEQAARTMPRVRVCEGNVRFCQQSPRAAGHGRGRCIARPARS